MLLLDHLLFLILLYCLMSIASILMYGRDKKAAIDKKRRISEDSLHAVSLLGGWPGALYAQKTYRHKTRKVSFRITFWFTVFLNVAVVIYSFTPHGRAFLQNLMGS